MIRILIVCSGNICRSPLAHGLMKHEVSKMELPLIDVTSAGTLDNGENPASKFSVFFAKEYGVDISKHLSRHISQEMIDDSNIILVMEEHHRQYIYENFGREKQVFLLTEYPDVKTGKGVFDPYGYDASVYKRVAAEINKHIERITGLFARGEI